MYRNEYECSAGEYLKDLVGIDIILKSRIGIYCVKYSETGTMHFHDMNKAQDFVKRWNDGENVKLY